MITGPAIARKHPIDQTIVLTQRVKSIELFQSPDPGGGGYLRLVAIGRGCRLGVGAITLIGPARNLEQEFCERPSRTRHTMARRNYGLDRLDDPFAVHSRDGSTSTFSKLCNVAVSESRRGDILVLLVLYYLD